MQHPLHNPFLPAFFLPTRNPVEPPEAFVTLIVITLYFANTEQQRVANVIYPRKDASAPLV